MRSIVCVEELSGIFMDNLPINKNVFIMLSFLLD